MSRFAEYILDRKIAHLGQICDARGIDCAELEDYLIHLIESTDLSRDEIYNEFIQKAMNWAGQKINNAASGAANMAGNVLGTAGRFGANVLGGFAQGAKNGWNRGQQPQQQQAAGGTPQTQQAGQQPQQQQAAGGTPQTQQAGQQGGEQAGQQLKNVQQLLGNLGQQVGQVTQLIDSLTKQMGQGK
jgi:hypothetical protein